MADGDMKRWRKSFDNTADYVPKHLVQIDGESLLQRLVRQLRELDGNCEIIITSHSPDYFVEGSKRYEPINNVIELDRFTFELIEDDVCFLYGDTFYTDEAIKKIFDCDNIGLSFFEADESIIAVHVHDAYIMKECMKKVRLQFLQKSIKECKGWQLYYCYKDKYLNESNGDKCFNVIDDETKGFNTYEEYIAFLNKLD